MKERNLTRFSHFLQEELSKIIMRDIEVEPGTLITVTQVDVSPDFRHAKVSLTVYPQKTQGSTLQAIRKRARAYEYELADLVRSGRSPQLEFMIDDSVVKGFQVDELLDQIQDEEKE